jgi:hypothetical protein
MAPSSDRNDQAVQIMINCVVVGQPINAQDAMELTGSFSVAEIKQKNFADNVRARAKRENGDMCELNQALQPWDEVFPRKGVHQIAQCHLLVLCPVRIEIG